MIATQVRLAAEVMECQPENGRAIVESVKCRRGERHDDAHQGAQIIAFHVMWKWMKCWVGALGCACRDARRLIYNDHSQNC